MGLREWNHLVVDHDGAACPRSKAGKGRGRSKDGVGMRVEADPMLQLTYWCVGTLERSNVIPAYVVMSQHHDEYDNPGQYGREGSLVGAAAP